MELLLNCSLTKPVKPTIMHFHTRLHSQNREISPRQIRLSLNFIYAKEKIGLMGNILPDLNNLPDFEVYYEVGQSSTLKGGVLTKHIFNHFVAAIQYHHKPPSPSNQ